MISKELRKELIKSKKIKIEFKKDYCNLINKILKENDINLKDESGYNLLYYTGFYNIYDLSKLLLEEGIDVNSQSNSGGTVLMKTSSLCKIEIVRLLLEYGADTQIKDNFGLTALDYAKSYGYLGITNLLEQYYKKDSDEKIEDLKEEVKRVIKM